MAKTKKLAEIYEFIQTNKTHINSGLEIKRCLNPSEQIDFCNYITAIVYAKGVYTPALFDFAVKYATLVCYTNITLPKDKDALNNVWKFIELYDITKGDSLGIDHNQLEALIQSAKDAIANRNNRENLLMATANIEGLCAGLLNTIDKFNDAMDKILPNINADNIADVLAFTKKISTVDDADIAKELVSEVKNNV